MAKSKGKNPHIAKQMAPTDQEHYGNNYGVLQHLSDGGMLDSMEDYLNKLGASTGQQSGQHAQQQAQPSGADLSKTTPDIQRQALNKEQNYADGGDVDSDSDENTSEGDNSLQLAPDDQKALMNYVAAPQNTDAKMAALGMMRGGDEYASGMDDRLKDAGYPDVDPTGAGGIEDVGARIAQRIIPASESLVGRSGLEAQKRIAQAASLDKITKEAEEMSGMGNQAANVYGNRAAAASKLATEARNASADQFAKEIANARTPQQQQALQSSRETFERLYRRARGGS